MPGEFWYTSTKAIPCVACGASRCFESVWRPTVIHETDPGGFLEVLRKTSFSRFDCQACGHSYEERKDWQENSYPRGDGGKSHLRTRALWLGERWLLDRVTPPQGRHAVGRLAVEQAFSEVLGLFPDDHPLWFAYASLGGESAPEAWQRALSLAPTDPATALGWAVHLAAIVRAQDGVGLSGQAINEYEPGSLDWITQFDRLSDVGQAAQTAIAAVVDQLAEPGATVIVASDAGESAWVRPAPGPKDKRLLGMALCLAGSAACRLSHQINACHTWLAKAVNFGPAADGLLGLQSLEQGLVYQAMGHLSLAQGALKNARSLFESRGVTLPPLLPAQAPTTSFHRLADNHANCPRCHASRGLSMHAGENRLVRQRERSDPRSVDVWFLQTVWYQCSACHQTWDDCLVTKRVETEF